MEETNPQREALEAALAFFAREAESVTYGHFHGGDPRDFSPGGEDDSTPEERAKWDAACKEWDAAEAEGKTLEAEPGPHRTLTDAAGKYIGHVTLCGFGLGANVYRDPEMSGLRDKCAAALKGERLVTEAERQRAERKRARTEWKRQMRVATERVVDAARSGVEIDRQAALQALDALTERDPNWYIAPDEPKP